MKEIEVTEAVGLPIEITPVSEMIMDSTSPTIGKLMGALAIAQGAMSNGTKDVSGYGYNYMDLGSLLDIVRPQLAKNGLALVQTHTLGKGKAPTVFVHTLLGHSSGEWIKTSLEMPITAMKQLSKPQMMGVSFTYGRRYVVQALFALTADADTDASER